MPNGMQTQDTSLWDKVKNFVTAQEPEEEQVSKLRDIVKMSPEDFEQWKSTEKDPVFHTMGIVGHAVENMASAMVPGMKEAKTVGKAVESTPTGKQIVSAAMEPLRNPMQSYGTGMVGAVETPILDFTGLEGYKKVSKPLAVEEPAAGGPTKIYHGTSAPVESVEHLDPGHSQEYSAAGPAVYLSRDPEVSAQYIQRKPEGKVLEGTLSPNTKLLDASAPLPDEIRAQLQKAGIEGTTYNEAMQGARKAAGSKSPESKIKAVQAAVSRAGYHGVENIFPGGVGSPKRDVVAIFGDDVQAGAKYKDLVKGSEQAKPTAKSEPKSESKQSAPKKVIEDQGLKYKGELTPGSGVHMFEHPDHPGKTASLDENDITPAAVQQKMQSKLKDFGIQPIKMKEATKGLGEPKNKSKIEIEPLPKEAQEEESEEGRVRKKLGVISPYSTDQKQKRFEGKKPILQT